MVLLYTIKENKEMKNKYRPFSEARKFARSLKLKSNKKWRVYCRSGKRPADVPTNPNRIYKKEWTTWGDWFGTGTIAIQIRSENYLPWPEAKIEYRRLAKKYGFKHDLQFRKFTQTHKKLLDDLRLPAYPEKVYTRERVWRKMKK